MTMSQFKKLCDLANTNPLSAKIKALQALPPDFIKKLKSIAKWSDEYIESWERCNTALEVKCPWGRFWLVPGPSRLAIQSKDQPKFDARELRTFAQTVHPPF